MQNDAFKIKKAAHAVLDEGRSPSEVARTFGVSRRTIYYWLNRAGTAAPKRGRPAIALPDGLVQFLADNGSGIWTTPDVLRILAQAHGVKASVRSLNRRLTELGLISTWHPDTGDQQLSKLRMDARKWQARIWRYDETLIGDGRFFVSRATPLHGSPVFLICPAPPSSGPFRNFLDHFAQYCSRKRFYILLGSDVFSRYAPQIDNWRIEHRSEGHRIVKLDAAT